MGAARLSRQAQNSCWEHTGKGLNLSCAVDYPRGGRRPTGWFPTSHSWRHLSPRRPRDGGQTTNRTFARSPLATTTASVFKFRPKNARMRWKCPPDGRRGRARAQVPGVLCGSEILAEMVKMVAECVSQAHFVLGVHQLGRRGCTRRPAAYRSWDRCPHRPATRKSRSPAGEEPL